MKKRVATFIKVKTTWDQERERDREGGREKERERETGRPSFTDAVSNVLETEV